MQKKWIIITALSLTCQLGFAAGVISLNSASGKEILINSLNTNNADTFLKETQYFTYQKNGLNCAPTSIAIALNTLAIQAPHDANFGNYSLFTQDTIFTPEVVSKTGISAQTVLKQPGLTLAQANTILNAYSAVQAQLYYVPATDQDKTHQLLTQAIKDNNKVVLVNILRSKMGESGGGHFSPLAAYDPKTDSFLFMDVTAHKSWGPSWVPFSLLYQGMATKDGDNNRGFIIINKK